MTKKIGIIIGIILMMSFLSGLNAIELRIHNVWIGTNDALIIHCDGFLVPGHTIVIPPEDLTKDVVYNVATEDDCPITVSQGNRSVTGILPSETSGIEHFDLTLPGPWQELPLPIEEK